MIYATEHHFSVVGLARDKDDILFQIYSDLSGVSSYGTCLKCLILICQPMIL